MKPMLAHVWEPHRVSYPCYVQPKFNGVRAVCGCDETGRRRFQSRDELPWDYDILSHISEELSFLPSSLVLDGELYVHGWSLQRINGAITPVRKVIGEDTRGVSYVIFDVVDYTKSFEDRFSRLDGKAALASDHWGVATTVQVKTESEVNNFYSVMVNEGFEGIMYRLGDCPYTVPKQEAVDYFNPGRTRFLSDKNNRTWHVLKRKSWLDDEFVVLRIEEGEGKRRGKVGAFIFDCGNGREGKVGSGLTDAQAQYYFECPELVVGKKIKVKYLTLTADGIPFNPTFEQLL